MKSILKLVAVLIIIGGMAVGLGFYWPFHKDNSTLRYPGTVQVQEVRLGSRLGGRVTEVLVREGATVKPGDELVRLEILTLEAKRDQLKARIAAADAEYRKAKYGPRELEIKEAEAVLKAAEARLLRAKVGPRKEQLQEAKQELLAAESDVSGTKDNLERLLKGRTAVTASDYEAGKWSYERALARKNVAVARVDLLLAGSRVEDIAEAEAERDQHKVHADLLKEGTREEDKVRAAAQLDELHALLRELEVDIREGVIRAQEAGVVEVIGIRPGDLLAPSQPALRLLRRGDQWVKFFVPETDLGKIRLNQIVEVTNDSYPDRKFRGAIIHIASDSEFTPRNVQSADERRHQMFAVKVLVEDPEGVFKAGMAADVYVPTNGGQP